MAAATSADYYQFLRLNIDCSPDEIKKAYRKLGMFRKMTSSHDSLVSFLVGVHAYLRATGHILIATSTNYHSFEVPPR